GRRNPIALHAPGAGAYVRVLHGLQRWLEHVHRQLARPRRERRGAALCRGGEDGQRAGADGTGAGPTLKGGPQRVPMPSPGKWARPRPTRCHGSANVSAQCGRIHVAPDTTEYGLVRESLIVKRGEWTASSATGARNAPSDIPHRKD